MASGVPAVLRFRPSIRGVLMIVILFFVLIFCYLLATGFANWAKARFESVKDRAMEEAEATGFTEII